MTVTMKFKESTIKLDDYDGLYIAKNFSGNIFLNTLEVLFTDPGTQENVWFKSYLLDPVSTGIHGECIEIHLDHDMVILKPAWIMKDGPHDYRIETNRAILLALADQWKRLVQQNVSQIYIVCQNGHYFMADMLSENIGVRNNIIDTPIRFAQRYIELNKKDSNFYTIKINGNYFLTILATLFNDKDASIDWFAKSLDCDLTEPVTIDGALTRLTISGNTVLIESVKDFNNYLVEIGRVELLHLINKWDTLVSKEAEHIFIICENEQYSIVETLPDEIEYHSKTCFCVLCDY